MRIRPILPLLCLLAGGAPARSAPTIDVRARTRVGLDAVVRTGAGVRIRGTLTDALTGEGVVGGRVLLEIDGARDRLSVVAGPGGRFDATVDLPPGVHDVAARFAGDEKYGDVATAPRPYDVDRGALALDVRVDLPADAAAPALDAHLLAGSSEGPEQVRLVVRAGDAGGLRVAGEVTTNERGEATLAIPREKLGPPGEKRVVVRFEGSEALNPAEAETTFFLQTTTQLGDLVPPPARLAHEAELAVSGKLLEAGGRPITGALVVLLAGARRLGEAVTDSRGRFELRADAAELGAGLAQVSVVFASTTPWRRGTRAGPFPVQIAPPEPVPVSYTVLTFGLTLAAVIGYVLLRARPWLRLAALVRRRRRRPDAAPIPAGLPEEVAPAPGLRLSRPGLISTLRRATDHAFTGRVCDVVRGQAVGGARLVLGAGAERREVVADARGHFEIELPPGWWQAEVSAHGYVTETVRAPIPHRGELRGARIDLLPVREKIFAVYRQVAAPLLPRPELWGVWTPREILDHVRATRPGGALGHLTALVEETYFSVRVPGEEILAAAQAGARAAAGELARG